MLYATVNTSTLEIVVLDSNMPKEGNEIFSITYDTDRCQDMMETFMGILNILIHQYKTAYIEGYKDANNSYESRYPLETD